MFVTSAVASACGLEEARKTGEPGFALAEDAKKPERTAGSIIVSPESTTGEPERPLSDKYYVDSEGNYPPDFIERGRGCEGLSMANLWRDSHSSPLLKQGASPEQLG